MGQQWNPPNSDVEEAKHLIDLADDRRQALRNVRAMEVNLASKYRLAQPDSNPHP